jgi:cytochrome c556
MKMIAGTIAAAMAVLAFGAASIAQQDPIAMRKALMKRNNDNAALLVKMMRGQEPFSAAKIDEALAQWADTGDKFPSLFPDNTKSGDTRATPAVWEKRAEFNSLAARFAKNSKDSRGKAKSADDVKAIIGLIGKDCGDCHETFRKPQ